MSKRYTWSDPANKALVLLVVSHQKDGKNGKKRMSGGGWAKVAQTLSEHLGVTLSENQCKQQCKENAKREKRHERNENDKEGHVRRCP